MKILFINYECPPLGGGGGIASYQLAAELAKQHNVDYLTMGFKGLPSCEIADGVHIIRVPVVNRKNLSTATYISMLSFVPSAIFKGIQLCKKQRYDCIHAWFVLPSGVCGAGLSRLFRIPLILTALGGDVYDPSKRHSPHTSYLMRLLITGLFNYSDRNTVESTNLKELVLRYYHIKKPVRVIPLGFTKPVFLHKSRTDLHIQENKIIFISVGRLVKRKGFEYAIKALSHLPGQSFHYYIIGDGPEEPDLKKLVMSLGMSEQVSFMGHLSDEKKFQYLSVSDVYLLPSLHEGFGICLLEAMHCGLPIVSTNNGGQEDILKDYENALFTDAYDIDAFAKKIQELLADTNLKTVLSTNNQRIIKHYYIEEIAEIYENLYKELIKSKRQEEIHENR
jgi:glycosyltransferase involved in cell wall biosynthesis